MKVKCVRAVLVNFQNKKVISGNWVLSFAGQKADNLVMTMCKWSVQNRDMCDDDIWKWRAELLCQLSSFLHAKTPVATV